MKSRATLRLTQPAFGERVVFVFLNVPRPVAVAHRQLISIC